MGVNRHRDWFIVGNLTLMLLAASPTLALFVHVPSGSKQFSELWLLGPGHKAEDYPFNVRANETYSVYIGVGNHLGSSAYYRILAKLRNQTQPLPLPSSSAPSPLTELCEFDLFVEDGKTWEMPLNFKILSTERLNGLMNLTRLSIDEVDFQLGSISASNEAGAGFYYQLFFELWLYNGTSHSHQFHNRFVGIWLNITDV